MRTQWTALQLRKIGQLKSHTWKTSLTHDIGPVIRISGKSPELTHDFLLLGGHEI
jgi:hypothetical protein